MNRAQFSSNSSQEKIHSMNHSFHTNTNTSGARYLSSTCLHNISVLDFLHHVSQTDEEKYPCAVREYWLQILPYVRVVRFLLTYITSFLVIAGLILNTLTFLVLSTPPSNGNSLSLYLRALAVSDNGALLFNYAVGVMRANFPALDKIYAEEFVICSFHKVFMDVFFYYSTWLVVVVTYERWLAIRYPMSMRNYEHKAIRVIVLVGLFSLLISLSKLYFNSWEEDSSFEYRPCRMEYMQTSLISMYFYVLMSTWLPLLLISIGNINLLVLIHHYTYQQQSLYASRGNPKPGGGGVELPPGSTAHRNTLMLLWVSITYLFLFMPLGIIEVAELYWDILARRIPQDPDYISWRQEKMLLKWIRAFGFFLYQWNFTINFFLYCISGRKFRENVKNFLRNIHQHCSKNKPSTISPMTKNQNIIRHQIELKEKEISSARFVSVL